LGEIQDLCIKNQGVDVGKTVAIVAGCSLIGGLALWLLIFKIWVKGVNSRKNKLKESIEKDVQASDISINLKKRKKKAIIGSKSPRKDHIDLEVGMQTTERHLI
jgi:hypothetical protein